MDDDNSSNFSVESFHTFPTLDEVAGNIFKPSRRIYLVHPQKLVDLLRVKYCVSAIAQEDPKGPRARRFYHVKTTLECHMLSRLELVLGEFLQFYPCLEDHELALIDQARERLEDEAAEIQITLHKTHQIIQYHEILLRRPNLTCRRRHTLLEMHAGYKMTAKFDTDRAERTNSDVGYICAIIFDQEKRTAEYHDEIAKMFKQETEPTTS